jgi:hypothetical protein
VHCGRAPRDDPAPQQMRAVTDEKNCGHR